MEEEVRVILRTALANAPIPATDLVERIRGRFATFGDFELPIAPREPVRAPAFPVDAAKGRSKRAAKPAGSRRRRRSG